MTTAIPTQDEARELLTRRLEHLDEQREQLQSAIKALTPAPRRGRPPKIAIDGQVPKRRGRPPKAKPEPEATNGGSEPVDIVA